MRLINRASFALFTLLILTVIAAAQSGRFTVQLEAAPTEAEAEEKLKKLRAKGVEAYVLKSQVPGKGTFFRIRVGTFPSQNEARKFGASLKQQGLIPDFFVAPFERPKEEVALTNKNNAKTASVPPPVKNEPAKEPPKAVTRNDAPKTVARDDTPKEVARNKSLPLTTGKETAPAPVASSVSMPTFLKFQDSQIGFSFDYPNYWTGKPLNPEDAKSQRVNAGALFQSPEDTAFLNAIWNELDKANSPANDNNLIVDVILKSMKSGEGTQMMEEVSRRVQEENGKIKTYLDLRASFITPGQSSPMNFLGKAVIIRTSKGILLVASFYSKEANANVPNIIEKIIASVIAPG